MTPAGRHLLAALHEPAGRDDALLRALTDQQWEDVAGLATRLGVSALLFGRDTVPIPEPTRARLEATATRSAIRVLALQRAFTELAERLAPAGVPLMALKGLHLATDVYASPTLRQMADIDVLVRREHLDTVERVALALGYSRPGLAGAATHHLPPLSRGSIALEVHWELLPPAASHPPDTQELFQRARPFSLAPNAVALCLEDLVVHICAHAAGNHVMEGGLRPLCDLQALVGRFGDRIDWAVVSQRAALWRCQRSTTLMLLLARRLLGVPVPPAMLHVDDAVPSDAFLETAATVAMTADGPLTGKSPTAAHLLALNGPVARTSYIVKQLLLPSARQAQVSPALRLSPIRRTDAVLRRAIGVTWRHAGWLWRAARAREGALRQAIDQRQALADWIRER